jgi:hypothetical protein
MIAISGQSQVVVWPGDANDDGIVNQFDVLPIGLRYLDTGPPRPIPPGLDWMGDTTVAWSDSTFGLINPAHHDANGDGIIDFDDLAFVEQNFDSIRAGGLFTVVPSALTSSGIPLYFNSLDCFYQDTTLVFKTTLFAGSATQSASDLYGLAFELNFDTLWVDSSAESVWVEPKPGFIDGDSLFIARRNSIDARRLSFGLSKSDRSPIGIDITPVADFYFVMEGNLAGASAGEFLQLALNNVVALSEVGVLLDVNHTPELFSLEPCDSNGIIQHLDEIENAKWKVWPNPASSRIILNNPDKDLKRFQLLGMDGRMRLSGSIPPLANLELDISELSSGLYLISDLETGQVKLIEIVH